MKRAVKITFIIAAIVTAVGAVGMVFSRLTFSLMLIGLCIGFGGLVAHLLSQKETDRVPVWLSVMFVLSLLPVLLCLYWSADAGINGSGNGMLYPIKYGWDAFRDTLLVTTLLFTAIPLIPAAIIVQVNFIVLKIKLMKKRNAERS